MVNNANRPCRQAPLESHWVLTHCSNCILAFRFGLTKSQCSWQRPKARRPNNNGTTNNARPARTLSFYKHSFIHPGAHPHTHSTHTQHIVSPVQLGKRHRRGKQRGAAAATVKVRMPKMQCQRNGNVEKQWKPLRRMFSYLLADSHSFSSSLSLLLPPSSRCACGEVQKCSSR